jgi:hypothetical protein
MSTDKIDPTKQDSGISSADDLVKGVELNEQELKRVSGGLKIELNDALVSSISHSGSSDSGKQ